MSIDKNTVSVPPLVLLSACRRSIGTAVFDVVRVKNVEAVTQVVRGIPVVLPTVGENLDIDALLARIDGVYLTGSESNVEPERYGEKREFSPEKLDLDRDRTTLPLLRAAIDAGIPLLVICRGFQELNVAFGGSLHQCVQESAGFMDHREDETQPRDIQYAPSHEIHLDSSGMLFKLLGSEKIRVNSLHQQGIKVLAPRLLVEAVAPDGLVEAVRVQGAKAFAFGVQWHPEWFAAVDPVSRVLFESFGNACRQYAAGKPGRVAPVHSVSI
jgi:putative glutamine amidotransferase